MSISVLKTVTICFCVAIGSLVVKGAIEETKKPLPKEYVQKFYAKKLEKSDCLDIGNEAYLKSCFERASEWEHSERLLKGSK